MPEGEDEAGNVEVKTWGDPHAVPAARLNAPKDHAALGEALGLMDFERAARMSGSRFVALKGGLARLERALGQFMLDIQTVEHGYGEVSPPLLVQREAAFGTGQLPKFEKDLFRAVSFDAELYESDLDTLVEMHEAGASEPVTNALHQDYPPHAEYRALLNKFNDYKRYFSDERYLIPTAEVSLTNLVREEITPGGAAPPAHDRAHPPASARRLVHRGATRAG